MTSTGRRTDGHGLGAVTEIDGAWERFLAAWPDEIEGWLKAEASFSAGADVSAGDRLLAAEAALQRAIVDFAATQPVAGGDPMPLALGLLRRAEELLRET